MTEQVDRAQMRPVHLFIPLAMRSHSVWAAGGQGPAWARTVLFITVSWHRPVSGSSLRVGTQQIFGYYC